MNSIHLQSLAATLDAVEESLFLGRQLTVADQVAAARWIASRQFLPGDS